MADDLADVIARWRDRLRCVPDHEIIDLEVTGREANALLDAAEAGMRARDAALEEAAQVADERAKEAREDEFCDRRELGDDYDPNSYGAGYNAGAHGSGVCIAREIRALRRPA